MKPANDLHCAECGYALRGLDETGDCPECGTPIARSTLSRQGLTKRELVVVVCRLFTLWIVVQFVMQLTLLVYSGIQYLAFGAADSWQWMLGTLVAVVMYAGIAAVLWWKSPWLAKRIIISDGLVFPGRSPSGRGVWLVGVRLMGLYIAANAVPDLVTTIVMHQWHDAWITAGIRLTLGLTLLFGWNRIARSVLWLRSAGTKSPNP